MDQTIKKKWVSALRGGDYTQGRFFLRSTKDNSFCCPGVLVDLFIRDHPESVGWVKYCEESPWWEFGMEKAYELLPEEVTEWARLSTFSDPLTTLPTTHGTTGVVSLTRINDDLKYSFNQIADLIENSSL